MVRRRAGRPLTPEDQEMWRRVTQTVRAKAPPAVPKSDEVLPPAPKPQAGRNRPSPPAAPRKDTPKHPRPDPISAAQLDGKLDSRLRRGRLEPERTLDLHGLTAARAEKILKLFIEQSRAEGLRLVLVITGKGRLRDDTYDVMPQRRGVLRDHLPVWVSAMGNAVVKTAPAHPRHGGSGAFYLYLRRRREGR